MNALSATHAASPVRSTVTSASAVDAVRGAPRVVLRLEGAAELAAACVAYAMLGGRWSTFALLFLVPDLSMLGYLVGRRAGAVCYNVAHSLLGPAALGAVSLALGAHGALVVACIWLAHVGFDRAMGYGLKYGTAFGDTHLGRVGRSSAA